MVTHAVVVAREKEEEAVEAAVVAAVVAGETRNQEIGEKRKVEGELTKKERVAPAAGPVRLDGEGGDGGEVVAAAGRGSLAGHRRKLSSSSRKGSRLSAMERRAHRKPHQQESPAIVVPSAGELGRSAAVQELMHRVIGLGQFSVGLLRRSQNRSFVLAMGMMGPDARPKPNGLHIAEMFDATFMVPGSEPLEPGAHGLKLEGMAAGHVPTCKLCRDLNLREAADKEPRVHHECYFHQMMECVRCGWNPPMTGKVVEQYDCSTRNRNSVVYKDAFDEQMAKLLKRTEHAGPVLVPYGGEPADLTLNRTGLNLKSSDLARARVRTKVAVDGPDSLAEANRLLVEMGEQPVKARLTTDATGSGVNEAALVPSFSYPTIHDAVRIIRRGDWLGKADVERYYMLFPLAAECRHLFGVLYNLMLYWFVALFFGFAAGACYASVWSAELRRWVLHAGIRCAHMMDDWLVAAKTEAEARANMGIIAALFRAAGIYMAPHKYAFGQQMLYLGVWFDTVRMSMSFDADQCKDFARILREASTTIQAGDDLTVTQVSSIAGKINWYGSLLQVGRLHDAAWWEYLAVRKRPNGQRFAGIDLRRRMAEDAEWWCRQLDVWAAGGLGGNEFPILSASELLERPGAVEIIQSDASGPDGCGYMFGSLHDDDDARYVSRRWQGDEASEHSTAQELYALWERVKAKPASETLIIWVSDSASAVYSVNKGRAKESRTRELVTQVLEECDRKGFQVVGVWIPRELNTTADFLSHLAHHLDRDSVTGWTSQLGRGTAGDSPASLSGATGSASAFDAGAVPSFLPGGGSAGHPRV